MTSVVIIMYIIPESKKGVAGEQDVTLTRRASPAHFHCFSKALFQPIAARSQSWDRSAAAEPRGSHGPLTRLSPFVRDV